MIICFDLTAFISYNLSSSLVPSRTKISLASVGIVCRFPSNPQSRPSVLISPFICHLEAAFLLCVLLHYALFAATSGWCGWRSCK